MDLELDLGKILKCSIVLFGKLSTVTEMVLKVFAFSGSLWFSDPGLLRL